MQIAQKEILFIYNSNDLQDRQALGYAKCLPNHKIKEVDLQKESFTETQVKQIADLLEVKPVSLIDQRTEVYQQSYSNTELTSSGALKAMAAKPELIKTPIAVYNDHAEAIHSPFQLVKQDLDTLPSISEYSAPPNGINIVHDPEYHSFSAKLGKDWMLLEYTNVSPGVIDFTSTFVPKKLRNQGFGSKLATVGLEYALMEGLKVKASCPFIADFAKDHPRYQNILVE